MGGAHAPVRWIAHRGWSTRFPENSMAAFAAAVAAGADEIEFDVRHTADGVPVVIHDPTLERVCELEGPVEERSAAELAQATVLGPQGARFPAMGLATLEQVLWVFAPHVGMNVHVKTVGPDAAALRMVQAAVQRHPQRHIYIGGNEEVLEAALEVCPEVTRCCLARQREPDILLRHALRYRCQGLQYFAKLVTPDGVAEAKAHGLFRNVFYADTAEDAAHLIGMGLDGVLTNDVGTLKAVLAPVDRGAAAPA